MKKCAIFSFVIVNTEEIEIMESKKIIDDIKKNVKIDTVSFTKNDEGKVQGKCLYDGQEVLVTLPKTIKGIDVLDAIKKNEITVEMLNKIAIFIYNLTLENTEKRIRVSVKEETYQNLMYWSKKRECSVSEYVNMAIKHMIAWENQDYDLPTLEQQRLNQLIDSMNTLSSNVSNMENVILSGFKSLMNLAMGDDYLYDDEEEKWDF